MKTHLTYNNLKEFIGVYENRPIKTNTGGMGAPDMFSLWLTLKTLSPNMVIESGVWKGQSTWMIRQSLPNSVIHCLDPNPHQTYKDKDATYLTGGKFKDFSEINIDDPINTLVFFDDHINVLKRIKECYEKKCKYIFFNDNYPVNCGGHLTLQHILHKDKRKPHQVSEEDEKLISSIIEDYYIFPNILLKEVKTGEGMFPCKNIFDEEEYDDLSIFKEEGNKYRWNTLVKLKNQ
jgi:hypothetical protein